MSTRSNDEEYRVPVRVHQTWWAPLIAGPVFLALAWSQFRDFEALEEGTRDSLFVPVLLKTLYEIGGKWGATFFFVGPGIFFIALGGYRFLTNRKALS